MHKDLKHVLCESSAEKIERYSECFSQKIIGFFFSFLLWRIYCLGSDKSLFVYHSVLAELIQQTIVHSITVENLQ